MQYLTMAQDRLMKAFSARALADAADFEASIEGVFKEAGSADPSAMSMNVTLQAGKSKVEWPATLFTFLAMPGEEHGDHQQLLMEQLQAVKQGFVGVQCEHSHDEDCEKLFDIVKVTKGGESPHFGEGKFVFVEVQMPKGPQGTEADEELAATLKEHDPKLLAEVNFGRTVEDMYDHPDENLAVLPKGVSVKVGAAFASTLFSALIAMAHGGAEAGMGSQAKAAQRDLKFMTGLATLKTRNEVLYRGDRGDAFGDIPTLAMALPMLKQQFKEMPAGISEPMKDLYKFCNGVAGIEVDGLPGGWELLVQFENFHPSKVLASILKPEKPE